MKPQFLKPSPELQHLITQYLVLKIGPEDPCIHDKFIPDGHAALVFNFNSSQASINPGKNEVLPEFFVVVPRIQPLKIEVSAPAESLIVMCKASVLSKVFDVKFNEPTEVPYMKADLFRGFPMFNHLSRIQNMTERIAFLEDHIRSHYPVRNYLPDEIDRLYAEIIGSEGKISIDEAMRSLETGMRSLRSRFMERVGINPKGLARIVRVNFVWRALSIAHTRDLQYAVYIGDFFDQSHLNRDFRMIVGETPRSFFNRNLEQVRLLSGSPDN
jgi:AraC-like DNA-binding protein